MPRRKRSEKILMVVKYVDDLGVEGRPVRLRLCPLANLVLGVALLSRRFWHVGQRDVVRLRVARDRR